MISTKFDPHQFFLRTEHVALSVAASEVFGLLKRTLDLPPSWAALVTRERGDHELVRAGGEVNGADADAVLFARTTPMELVLQEENLNSKDRFLARAEVRIRASLIPDRGELLSFQRAVAGSHRVVNLERLARYFEPVVRSTLAHVAADHEAATLLGPGTSERAGAALVEALNGPCFDSGIKLEGKPIVRFSSESYELVRAAEEEAARKQSEHQAAQQLERAIAEARDRHLDHLRSLLERLDKLAADSPSVALPDLMKTFSERERGELYEALFAADEPESRTKWVVVAAGEELLFFDPQRIHAPARRLTMSGEAGPIRSIQTVSSSDRGLVLLLGAARGVYSLPIERAEPDAVFLVPGAPEVRGGFNAAAVAGEFVYATHSELGLYEWQRSEPLRGRRLFEAMTADANAVRGVIQHDGLLYCSVDDQVVRWMPGESGERPKRVYTGSRSTVTALTPTDEGLFAGNSEGDVLHWPSGRSSEPERIHVGTGRAVESIWLLSSRGVQRIIFADTSMAVTARVLGDSFICRYEAGGQTLRRVEVAPDLVVATNELRDRLFCWKAGKADRPEATISVASIVGRSVQDVCLVKQA